MAFQIRELMFSSLPITEDDRSWLAIIGCGHQSLLFHGNTQKPYVRLDPIDHVSGLKTVDDLRALRQELKLLMARLNAIENQMTGKELGDQPNSQPEAGEDVDLTSENESPAAQQNGG